MEYCAVQGPLLEEPVEVQRYDVQRIDGLVLVALFTTKSREVQILDFLAKEFLEAVSRLIRSGDDVITAGKSALKEMDRLVQERFKPTEKEIRFCAVDLPSKVVYSMGNSCVVPLILGSDHSARNVLWTEVPLYPDERHLVIATTDMQRYMVGGIGPILESRIRRVGLVEACKDIVGKHADIISKTLIVVTLKKDAHRPYPNQPQLPVGPWEEYLRFVQELGLDSDDADYYQIRRLYKDPRAYLRPLKEDEICQQPEPVATFLYAWKGRGPLGTIGVPRVSEGLSLEAIKEPELERETEL